MTGRYQPYPKYQETGIEWLGQVPADWSIHALKRAVDGCVNGVWGEEPDGERDLTVLRVADFDRTSLTVSDKKLTTRSIPEKDRKTRLLKIGDLLIEKSGGGDKTLVGCVVKFDKSYPAVTSNFVAKMTPKSEFDSGFLSYAFSHLYAGRVNYPSIKQTTGIQNLDSDAYLMERFVFPGQEEQCTIAAFLDHETARIDRLIAKQQRLIELLKEKRQAVISHAVTKGLDPGAPMKDSGVVWLGEVPAHWKVGRMGYYCYISNGTTPSKSNPEYWTEGDIPWLSSGTVNQYEITDPSSFITVKALSECSLSLLPPGTVVIGMIGQGKTRGMSAITRIKTTINQNLAAAVPNQLIDSEFLLFLLQSAYTALRDTGRGGNQAALNCELIADLKITVPSLTKQQEIASYLKGEIARYEMLTDRASTATKLLQERRTALISAAVTGKIDLRGWRHPDAA